MRFFPFVKKTIAGSSGSAISLGGIADAVTNLVTRTGSLSVGAVNQVMTDTGALTVVGGGIVTHQQTVTTAGAAAAAAGSAGASQTNQANSFAGPAPYTYAQAVALNPLAYYRCTETSGPSPTPRRTPTPRSRRTARRTGPPASPGTAAACPSPAPAAQASSPATRQR